MAYLGTPPRSRVLSSADIDPGSISLDDISFTDQPANLNITGTYDKHTMRLADGVTVVGDVNITDNLILSKISDDGNAITLTNDSSTRTITGTGSLEASTLTQTPNASLTGMTGTIGSAVTGSPNLNLTTGLANSNTQFPAGHVLQVVTDTYSTEANVSITTSWRTTNLGATITPTSASSEILVLVSNGAVYLNTSGVTCIQTVFRGGTLTAHTAATGTNIGHASYGLTATYFGNAYPQFLPMHCSHLDSPNTTSATNYTVCFQIPSGAMTVYYCYANNLSSITLMEIAG